MKHFFVFCLIGIFAGSLGMAGGVLDAEERLADYRSARSTYDATLNTNLGNPEVQRRSTLKSSKLSEEEFEARRRWFVARYPGTDIAARVEADRMGELFDGEDWAGVAAVAGETMDKYTDFGLIRARILYLLVRIINNKQAPDAAREACLEVLLDHSQNAPAMLSMVGNYLSQNAAFSNERKRELALRGESVAGNSPRVRDFVWRFLAPVAKESPESASKQIEQFLQRYPEESLAALEAKELLLEIRPDDPEAVEQLRQLRQEKKEALVEVKRLCKEAEVAAQAGNFTAVGEIFDQLEKQPRWAVDIPWWGKFVAAHSENLPLPLVRRAMEIVPPGNGGDELLSGIVRNESLRYHAEGARLVMEVMDKYGDDIMRHGSVLRSRLLRMRVPLEDPELRLWANKKAADIALRLGMKDAAADFLFDSSKFLVLTEPDVARRMLADASAMAPGSEASVNAAWLVALMDGELGVVAPLSPRNTLPTGEFEPPRIDLPKVKLPQPENVVSRDGVYTLRSQEADADMADWAARSGSDDNAGEAWEPKQLPASLIVPLKSASTLKDVRLQFSAPSKFTVTLLDANGRALSRQARDWPFWDPYDLQTPWPGPDETIELLPVADVGFIRVDLFESQTDKPTLRKLEARATPYASRGGQELAPQNLPAGTKSLSLKWKADHPESEVVYDIGSEAVHPYPIVRWFRPWVKKTMRNNLGMEFRGDEAMLSITGGPGEIKWSLNGGPLEELRQETNIDRKEAVEVPVKGVTDGRQHLRLTKNWVAGRAVTTFDKLTVKARAKAGVRVRFGDGKKWGEWQGPFWQADGVDVPAPENARQFQLGIALDARPILAQATSTFSNPDIQPSQGVVADTIESHPDAPSLPEQLDAVVESVAGRRVAVVYSKTGSPGEYELARRIATQAGIPLISDDVALNLNSEYYGPLLAVGTPRDNRIARQLIGMCGVWNDPGFLNNPEGVVGRVDDIDGNTYFFVTGDTPAAVEKAGERLLAKIPAFKPNGAPFHVFGSNTLEVVYPWQPGFDKPEPGKITLQLGVNDRRSRQFALTTNRELASLEVAASELRGPDGAVLPAPRVRALGGYEWIPFFGDLRLPNFLLEKPVLPVPAFTSLGFWVSVQTAPGTKPGKYQGTVKIQAGDFVKELPLLVTVDPVELPDFARIDTYSYASVPWWYLPGTKAFDEAVRALAENESEKRVNTVAPRLIVSWEAAPSIIPAQYSIAVPQTALAQLNWQPFKAEPKEVPDGQALFVKFPEAIQPVEIGGGFQMSVGSDVEAAAAGQLSKPFPAQTPLGGKEWSAMRFPASGAKADVFVFKSTDGKAFKAGLVRAFTDRDKPIVRYDFRQTLRQMDIIEAEYKKAGIAPPNFRLHMIQMLGPEVSQNLFGVGHWHFGGGVLATDFVRQLKEQLKPGGREERTFLKVGDEPRTLGEWAKAAKPYKDGGLRVMTAHYSGRPDVKDAVGIMNPWCPNYEHDLDDPLIRERQKAGDKMWWYQCGVPATRLTGKPADNLPIYWLTAKWHLDGVANYAALSAHEGGPEGSPIPFRYDHGMGYRINYLPDGRLLDSPRRELEAEGIKDYTLIENIRDGIAKLKGAGKTEEAQDLEAKLDATIESVVPGKRGYPTDPGIWLAARESLYELAGQAALKTKMQ